MNWTVPLRPLRAAYYYPSFSSPWNIYIWSLLHFIAPGAYVDKCYPFEEQRLRENWKNILRWNVFVEQILELQWILMALKHQHEAFLQKQFHHRSQHKALFEFHKGQYFWQIVASVWPIRKNDDMSFASISCRIIKDVLSDCHHHSCNGCHHYFCDNCHQYYGADYHLHHSWYNCHHYSGAICHVVNKTWPQILIRWHQKLISWHQFKPGTKN